MRWPDDRHIEIESVGDAGEAAQALRDARGPGEGVVVNSRVRLELRAAPSLRSIA